MRFMKASQGTIGLLSPKSTPGGPRPESPPHARLSRDRGLGDGCARAGHQYGGAISRMGTFWSSATFWPGLVVRWRFWPRSPDAVRVDGGWGRALVLLVILGARLPGIAALAGPPIAVRMVGSVLLAPPPPRWAAASCPWSRCLRPAAAFRQVGPEGRAAPPDGRGQPSPRPRSLLRADRRRAVSVFHRAARAAGRGRDGAIYSLTPSACPPRASFGAPRITGASFDGPPRRLPAFECARRCTRRWARARRWPGSALSPPPCTTPGWCCEIPAALIVTLALRQAGRPSRRGPRSSLAPPSPSFPGSTSGTRSPPRPPRVALAARPRAVPSSRAGAVRGFGGRASAVPFPPVRLLRSAPRLRPPARAVAGRTSHGISGTPVRPGVRPPRLCAGVRARGAGNDRAVAPVPASRRHHVRARALRVLGRGRVAHVARGSTLLRVPARRPCPGLAGGARMRLGMRVGAALLVAWGLWTERSTWDRALVLAIAADGAALARRVGAEDGPPPARYVLDESEADRAADGGG